ncbi:Rab3 GTPase-activating protein regulatory subunit [Pseudolycoriella hygida]|uniref:Rab3 GTPase-activating protein regulatory subunit n=1 Tax=Pseudolycoriella hygida TaxID=35572 RepID=A0A9Q0MM85_9DIPT|nr:Rab3 GTPase-activating protein regulatory subunit [Pseudolycoriella hygida]
MSCEIKSLAKINDLKEVQEILGFSQDENWLNSVFYSLSPTGELLVIAHGSKFVLLTSRWNNDQTSYTYTIKTELKNPNDIITSLICLPIVGTSNIQNSAEWTCIAVGLSSGNAIFYSDSGIELFTQQWHNEPIHAIKAQSGKKINEEIHIFYLSCVCIIQGSHLFTLLRNMKNYLQKSKNNVDLSPSQDTLPCRKWGYGGRNVIINDAVVVGPQKTCTFDHLLTASLEGGFYAKYKSAPPQSSLVIGVGTKPYAGFHWAKEGFVQPVLADVARAVASKIKSALPTWLMGSTPQSVDTPPPPIPVEGMSLRFGVCDYQRTGISIWLSPNSQLAAVTDNLGRIILIDCFKGIALRVWKGYRDAQCSFMNVNEKASKIPSAIDRRHAMFLVIFAPRRSCLEIWSLQRGQKIAAFNVSRFGQLIYNSHHLMGATGSSKVKYTTNSCIFFDPSDQSLKEIVIPFHCAITDSNSKTAKDLHLLRRIKMCLRSGDGTEDQLIDEISFLSRSLQTDEIRLQCIEMLVRNNKVTPKIMSVVLAEFLQQMPDDEQFDQCEDAEMSAEDLQKIHIKNVATNYSRLVDFYLYTTTDGDVLIGSDTKNEDHDQDDDMSKPTNSNLQMNMSELENLQKFVDLAAWERTATGRNGRVTFHEKVKSNAFVDYLSIFDCQDVDIALMDRKEKHFPNVGCEIFRNFLEKGKSLAEFYHKASGSSISADDLMTLFLSYWLDRQFLYTKSEDLINDLSRFTSIIEEICALCTDAASFDYDSLSLWWQNIREILLESPCALMSLLAAMMCRNHAARYRKRENSNDSTEEEVWEQVSHESAQWSLLIGKLEDIAVLSAILSCPKHCENAKEPTLPILEYDQPDVSLKAIVSGGKGICTELIAKWISSSGCNPNTLVEPVGEDGMEIQHSHEATETATENSSFLNYVNILREHFPFSLQSGVVLCQLTWTYMCEWSKNMTKLDYIKAALDCLDAINVTDNSLKHGICCMIWNAHLKIPLEATKKLINKTGRLPKEKLCQQDIGLSDSLVPELLQHCSTFLKHFASSVDGAKIELKYEELLQDGPVPLTLLALQQNTVNVELLRLHKELNDVLYIISSLNIKYFKPVQSLFDAMSNQSFFSEINRKLDNDLPRPDAVLQKKRIEFLCLAISSTMDLIREDLQGIFLDDHIAWMGKIEELANGWDLNAAELRKHQIVELYAHGWDEFAEDILESVLDTQSLGVLLLKIAGRRLNIYTRNTSTYAQVASVGPLISDYLDTLEESSSSNQMQVHRTSSDISLQKLINLSGHVYRLLSEKDSRNLRIAAQLFDACNVLKDNELDN